MAAAVCVACGAMKRGAFTPCPRCQHDATTVTERARAVLLSDRYLDPAGLEAASAAILAGGPAPIDEARVAELTAAIGAAPSPSRGSLVFAMVGFGVAVAALAGMAVLIVYGVINLLT